METPKTVVISKREFDRQRELERTHDPRESRQLGPKTEMGMKLREAILKQVSGVTEDLRDFFGRELKNASPEWRAELNQHFANLETFAEKGDIRWRSQKAEKAEDSMDGVTGMRVHPEYFPQSQEAVAAALHLRHIVHIRELIETQLRESESRMRGIREDTLFEIMQAEHDYGDVAAHGFMRAKRKEMDRAFRGAHEIKKRYEDIAEKGRLSSLPSPTGARNVAEAMRWYTWGECQFLDDLNSKVPWETQHVRAEVQDCLGLFLEPELLGEVQIPVRVPKGYAQTKSPSRFAGQQVELFTGALTGFIPGSLTEEQVREALYAMEVSVRPPSFIKRLGGSLRDMAAQVLGQRPEFPVP